MKTIVVQGDWNRGNPETHSYSGWVSTVWWEKIGVLPASHSSPPTLLSTLLTLDLLHIKEPSLQRPSHVQGEIQGGGTREPGGSRGGGWWVVGYPTPTAYRSIVQNKSIPAAICLTWQGLGQDRAEAQEMYFMSDSCQRTMCKRRLLKKSVYL